jgi:hypothetical protein
MTVPPPEQYPELAPSRYNYSARYRDEYSGGADYLIGNPPFPQEAPVHIWRVLAGNHDIDSKAKPSALAKEFASLVRDWKRDTEDYSVIAKRYRHHAYKAILDMKERAVPMILNELRREPDHWFAALEQLTGKNPARQAKTFYEAVDLWIAWAISEDLIS